MCAGDKLVCESFVYCMPQLYGSGSHFLHQAPNASFPYGIVEEGVGIQALFGWYGFQ
jgi:hypothetical protein